MRCRTRLAVVILAVTLVCAASVVPASAQLGDSPLGRPRPDVVPDDLPRIRRLLASYFVGRTITSAVNSILLLYLLLVYYGIYRDTKSSFSLGLVIMSAAMLLFTVSYNPLIHWVIGSRKLLGVFNFVSDIFTTVVAVVLIYLSRQ
jgi:hypothetical protein